MTHNLVVGIDGPVLAGKSTMIAGMANALSGRGHEVAVAPCFVEVSARLGERHPSPVAATPASQRLDVLRHLVLELNRREQVSSDVAVTILDRTLWTVLAHCWALERMRLGTPLHELLSEDEQAEFISRANDLDLLICMEVSHERQVVRSASREPMPNVFTNSTFNDEFRAYFRTQYSGSAPIYFLNVDNIDAGQAVEQSLAALRRVESGLG